MTNGSSQGLFVIVAIVIFGIFVVISYLLFRDKLQTGLASIFSDSIDEVNNNVKINPNLILDPEFKENSMWGGWSDQLYKSFRSINNSDGTVTLDKYDFHTTTTERAFFYLNTLKNPIFPEKDKAYSTNIEIFIENLENKKETTFSSFYIRVTGIDNTAIDLGTVNLKEVAQGKWVKLELNNLKIPDNTDANKAIQFAFGFSADTKAKINIRKPKIEIGNKSTIF